MYSLTEAVVLLASSGGANVDVTIRLWSTDGASNTPVPQGGIGLVLDAAISVHDAPTYVTLPLSALQIDDSPSGSTTYALVLSFSASVDWYSVLGSLSADGRPESGVATTVGNWVR